MAWNWGKKTYKTDKNGENDYNEPNESNFIYDLKLNPNDIKYVNSDEFLNLSFKEQQNYLATFEKNIN